MQLRGMPEFRREYRFAAHHVGLGPGIKARLAEHGLSDWRFDFAWPEVMFAVEVEGGGWSGGRHTRGAGFAADMQKYHHAAALGWFVYRCDRALIDRGLAAKFIRKQLRMLSGGGDVGE